MPTDLSHLPIGYVSTCSKVGHNQNRPVSRLLFHSTCDLAKGVGYYYDGGVGCYNEQIDDILRVAQVQDSTYR